MVGGTNSWRRKVAKQVMFFFVVKGMWELCIVFRKYNENVFLWIALVACLCDKKNGHMNITTNNVLGCFYKKIILHLKSSRFKLLIKENGTHPKINNSILGHVHGHNKKIMRSQKNWINFYHLLMTQIITYKYNTIPPRLVWHHTTIWSIENVTN